MRPLLFAVLAAVPWCLPPLAGAEMIGGNPGPAHNYVCPHSDGQGALDCYFDAVQHLYTMCRNVKSIEILEFGYENSQEGVNDSKYEYCLDKQKLSMKGPYQAALKEASISKQAAEAVRGLQEHWLGAMQHIKWNAGESDDDYKARLAHAYDEFKDRIEGIRTIVAVVREHTAPIGAAHAKPAAKSKDVPARNRPAARAAAPKAVDAPKTPAQRAAGSTAKPSAATPADAPAKPADSTADKAPKR